LLCMFPQTTDVRKMEQDPRFSHAQSDPRFSRLPRRRRKVAVDSRFATMFNDPNFSAEAVVDKYGRRRNEDVGEDLRRLYHVEEENPGETTSQGQKKPAQAKQKRNPKQFLALDTQAPVSNDDSEEGGKAIESTQDLTSSDGEESIASANSWKAWASSSSSEEEGEESLQEATDHFGEDAHDIPTSEETNRIAVLNLQWSQVKAIDIFALLQSFVPSTGMLKSVTVYPSEFGVQEQAKEETLGPEGIWKVTVEDEDEELELTKAIKRKQGKVDECEVFDMDRLRQYERSKLRWFYAVAEFDSPATALAVYGQCDGLEFERSSNILDLRFVPDNQDFARPCRDKADHVPIEYQPPKYFTKALQQTKVDLSWEAETPNDVPPIPSKSKKQQLRLKDYSALLASSPSGSEGEDVVLEKNSTGNNRLDQKGQVMKTARRDKYKNLLAELGVGTELEDGKFADAEITFTPGLSSEVKDLVDRASKKKEKGGESAFEQYLQARKEKRRERRKEQAQLKEQQEDSDEAKKQEKGSLVNGERAKAELELLLADETLGRSASKGFKLKKAPKGKKRRVEDEEQPIDDSFELNTSDSRFAALFESPEYALDPTHPQFQRTGTSKRILEERQKRQHVHGMPEHKVDDNIPSQQSRLKARKRR